MANKTKLTLPKRKAFLAVLAQTASVTRAANQIGLSRGHMYTVRAADAVFAADWDSAVEEGTDRIEDEALRRAVDGWDEPVYHQGVMCGTVRRYSDGLLTMLLKARRPEKYRDRSSLELGGKDGQPIKLEVEFV